MYCPVFFGAKAPLGPATVMSDLILKANKSLNLNNQETYSPELSFMVLLNPLQSYKVLDGTVWSSSAPTMVCICGKSPNSDFLGQTGQKKGLHLH